MHLILTLYPSPPSPFTNNVAPTTFTFFFFTTNIVSVLNLPFIFSSSSTLPSHLSCHFDLLYLFPSTFPLPSTFPHLLRFFFPASHLNHKSLTTFSPTNTFAPTTFTFSFHHQRTTPSQSLHYLFLHLHHDPLHLPHFDPISLTSFQPLMPLSLSPPLFHQRFLINIHPIHLLDTLQPLDHFYTFHITNTSQPPNPHLIAVESTFHLSSKHLLATKSTSFPFTFQTPYIHKSTSRPSSKPLKSTKTHFFPIHRPNTILITNRPSS